MNLLKIVVNQIQVLLIPKKTHDNPISEVFWAMIDTLCYVDSNNLIVEAAGKIIIYNMAKSTINTDIY